jgi:uncharacterized protein (TIGR00251 family)
MHGRKTSGPASPATGNHPQPAFLTTQSDGVTLAIKLQPRASQNEIGAASGPELRIRVTAPPVDAAANEALLRLLADALDCPRGKVELVRGHTARHKVVKVYGVPATEILTRLASGTP